MWKISDGESVELARKAVPNLLSCSEMTVVWVTWDSGVITFGTGNPESNGVLSAIDDRPFNIHGVGVTSITLGVWKFIIKANPTGYYCRMSYTYATGYLISITTQKTRTYCAIECQKSNDCLGFNFRYKGILNCELVEGGQLVIKDEHYEWHFYSKCLQDNDGCVSCNV
ncbi:Hypothetical predicted protein [Mytilus galloprovincialis]|uniref:Farnesoic acid O-methyl transferase domain-containing protein n=1 Tax=Mytilus galloprovincialis TaxID=29158 RepID=A0A8B6EAT6_MYTGA|nr:Hypothetical predicted protein [Mytilus galloprovincialis]